MTLHLEKISAAVAPGAHAVLVMGQAGWHTSDKLDLPANVSILNHCCDAWNKLITQPWKIMHIGYQDWAHRS